MNAPDDALLDAARSVLDRQGFFGATFEAVAAQAGGTPEEVRAAFGDMPGMFLAVVDRFLAHQMAKYDVEAPGAASFEEAMRHYGRAVGRARLADGMPSWDRVLVEFWIFATRNEPWRSEVCRRNTANLDRVGARLGELAAAWDMEFTIPLREVARGVFSLGRGMGLEVAMDPSIDRDTFATMFWAYIGGLARPAAA